MAHTLSFEFFVRLTNAKNVLLSVLFAKDTLMGGTKLDGSRPAMLVVFAFQMTNQTFPSRAGAGAVLPWDHPWYVLLEGYWL